MEKPLLVLRPGRPSALAYFQEIWRYRHLLLTLGQRDLKVRFAQTALGWLWALLLPLLSLGVLYLLFQRVVATQTQGVPFFLYALSGLLFWHFFQHVVAQSASALIGAQAIVKKIYFPRAVLPLSKAGVALVDLGVSTLVFGLWLGISGEGRPLALLALPFVLLPVLAGAWGLGLWISALSIRYRDLQQVVPLLLQLLFFLTPVAYEPAMLSAWLGDWSALVYLNPSAGAMQAFRALVFDLPWSGLWALSALSGMLFLLSGWWYFGRVEQQMADWI